MSSTYKSERVDFKDENWEKGLEQIIKKKIYSYIREKGLLDPTYVVIDPPFHNGSYKPNCKKT